MRNWFSNFIPFDIPMKYGGDTYLTPENFYQAMKTKDSAQRTRISKLTPSQAKWAGRGLDIRPDWNDIKLKVMEYALRHKFTPGVHQHQLLMDTGSTTIVEYNTWHDNFWGVCYCGQLTGSPFGLRSCTRGKNHLGKILMRLRAEYRNEEYKEEVQ